MNESELCIKDALKVLSLFFALAVISLVMVYSKFTQAMDSVWQDEKERETIFDNELFCEIFDLDSYETSGGVYEFGEKSYAQEYVECGGKGGVISAIMDGCIGEN